MTDFSRRSEKKELLDRDDIPFGDISRNMAELEFINRWLGGHAITRSGFRQVLNKISSRNTAPIVVAEIGCGGGDNLQAISSWCIRNNISCRFIGIDKNPECIEHARRTLPDLQADWIVSDYRQALFESKPDIVFSSLFCHHFTDDQLKEQLKWMKENSRSGFFINDLHRHPLAYYSILLLTRIFSKSYLVKNDAPLSVIRGFSRSDWNKLLNDADLPKAHVKWKWAFRWLVSYLSS